MAWKIDPQVLEDLNYRKYLTADFLNRIFGGTAELTPALTDFPYSLATKLNCLDAGGTPVPGAVGILPEEICWSPDLDADLDIGGEMLMNACNVMDDVVDVTAYGCSPDPTTDNWTGLLAAITAAKNSNTAGIVYFPRTAAGKAYHFKVPVGSGYKYLPLEPNLTYIGTPGVYLVRDYLADSDNDKLAVVGLQSYSVGHTCTSFIDLTFYGSRAYSGVCWEESARSNVPSATLFFQRCNFHYCGNQVFPGFPGSRYGVRLKNVEWCLLSDCYWGFQTPKGLLVENCAGAVLGGMMDGVGSGEFGTAWYGIVTMGCGQPAAKDSFSVIGLKMKGKSSVVGNPIYLHGTTQAPNAHNTVSGCMIQARGALSTSHVLSDSHYPIFYGNSILPDMHGAAGQIPDGLTCNKPGGVIVANMVAGPTNAPYGITGGIRTLSQSEPTLSGRNVIALNTIGPQCSWIEGRTVARTGHEFELTYRNDRTRTGMAINNLAYCTLDELTAFVEGKPAFSWKPIGSGASYTVRSISVFPEGEEGSRVVLAGMFNYCGAATTRRIAKWDGSRFSPIGTGFDGYVNGVTKVGGRCYIYGSFTKSGDGASTMGNLAYTDDLVTIGRLLLETRYTFGGITKNGHINCAAEWGRYIVFGGTFNEVRTQGGTWVRDLNHILFYDPITGVFSNETGVGGPYNPPCRGIPPEVNCLLPMGASLLIGGQFQDVLTRAGSLHERDYDIPATCPTNIAYMTRTEGVSGTVFSIDTNRHGFWFRDPVAEVWSATDLGDGIMVGGLSVSGIIYHWGTGGESDPGSRIIRTETNPFPIILSPNESTRPQHWLGGIGEQDGLGYPLAFFIVGSSDWMSALWVVNLATVNIGGRQRKLIFVGGTGHASAIALFSAPIEGTVINREVLRKLLPTTLYKGTSFAGNAYCAAIVPTSRDEILLMGGDFFGYAQGDNRYGPRMNIINATVDPFRDIDA